MDTTKHFNTWITLSERQQNDVVGYIYSSLGSAYVHVLTRSYSDNPALRIPTFLHIPSGIEFNFLFGSIFQMGLSEAEEKSVMEDQEEIDPEDLFAETMRPVHEVRVNPFLVARFPCTQFQAQKAIYLDPVRCSGTIGWRADGTEIARTPNYAMDLTREEAETIAAKYDFSLPSEAQWEYACRGLTTTPYYFRTPSLDDLEREVLMREFSDPELCLKAANPFGLVGLSVGEWCQDSYRKNYENAPDSDMPILGPSPYVVRGGAAMVWPWQGCGEWRLCMSAHRMRSDATTSNPPMWAARFVKRLDGLL